MPIRVHGGSVGDEERASAQDLFVLLDIPGLADKNANQLSGAQNQAIGLAW